jgi:hypothetical protein
VSGLVRVDEVEFAGSKWERSGVGDYEGGASRASWRRVRSVDLVRVEVDADRVEFERCRGLDGSGTVAAPDVEQALAGLGVGTAEALLRLRRDASAVAVAVDESFLELSHLHDTHSCRFLRVG